LHFIKIACLEGPAGAQERLHLTDAGTVCGLGAGDHSMRLCNPELGTMPPTAIAGMRPALPSGAKAHGAFPIHWGGPFNGEEGEQAWEKGTHWHRRQA
jgi:hypothetical protein